MRRRFLFTLLSREWRQKRAHFMVRPHLTVLLCNKKIDNRSFKKCNDPNPKELFGVVVKILAHSLCCSIFSSSLHSCHTNVTSRLYSTFIFSLKFTLSPHCSLHNEIVLWVHKYTAGMAIEFYKQTLPKEQRTKGSEYFDSFNTF